LESWSITPECRERGIDVAWEDAVSRLREVYDAQLQRHGGEPITLSLAIHIDKRGGPTADLERHLKDQLEQMSDESDRSGILPYPPSVHCEPLASEVNQGAEAA